MRRTLFGPLPTTFRDFPDHELRSLRDAQEILAFNEEGNLDLTVRDGDDWDAIASRFPPDWRPDLVCLWLPYTRIPAALWQAPVPLIGLAPDWNLLAHPYRHQFPRCDAVVTDALGVERFGELGFDHLYPGNLFGVGPRFLDFEDDAERDIDVLFVGNLHPAVQRERLAWLGRIARLSREFRVEIHTGVFGDDYRFLLQRSKVVFNRSIRGECNQRAFEAVASGCLLFQEASNRELPEYLSPGVEYVPYTDDNLEDLLRHHLTDDRLRQRIATRAKEKAPTLTFEALFRRIREFLEADRDRIETRMQARLTSPLPGLGRHRVWEAASSGSILPALDAAASQPESDATLRHDAGVLAPEVVRSAEWFARALDAAPDFVLARLHFAETLAQASDRAGAIAEAREALRRLEGSGLSRHDVRAVPYPPRFDLFRVEWERAGSLAKEEERREKERLVRWRVHQLLATWTGELSHFHACVLARPDLPATRAALGCALARAGQFAEAVGHLKAALDGDPFDAEAARALFHALGEIGDTRVRRRLIRDRLTLHRAAPKVVPVEDWFARDVPTGDELVSIVIPCWNELEFTRGCVESVLRHARRPYELVLIDNGSTDATPDYFRSLVGREGPERIRLITNPDNLGFVWAVNQGLEVSEGEYLVLLNNDTLVTPGWLERLVEWSLVDFPHVGMAGPSTNAAFPPQEIPVDYREPDGLFRFARLVSERHRGQALDVVRLSGFCVLIRREVLEKVGKLDERFGVGFFDDDDLGLRVRNAGYRLLAARDVFVHHFGSRTFRAAGFDTERMLRDNLERFRAKWGDEAARPYRLPQRETGRQRVSLCMMVKNEESNLGACLESVRDLVDEVIVVDTGSTDRTKEIAQEMGAKVFDFPWVDSFAAARNEGIRHATGDWVFWMDADDRLPESSREKLRSLFAGLRDENAAYVLKCLCVPDAPGGTATVVDHVRLFRNLPSHRWKYRVHEQILPAIRQSGGTVRWSEVTIHHVGYVDPALRARKLERDLRLLELERSEQPDDPFTLFNLGSVLHERREFEAAIEVLEKSLRSSHPSDSIVRKLYALLAQCRRESGRPGEAVLTLREGLGHYPDDAELLFLEGLLHREAGDLAAAEESLTRLLAGGSGPHFASVDAGLRGFKARHNRALVRFEQGKLAEAEADWREAIAAEPGFLPAWVGLGELLLRREDGDGLAALAEGMERLGPGGRIEATILRVRGHLERGEHGSAKDLLDEATRDHPDHLGLRVLASHACLRTGTDERAAEAALREVLRLDPHHAEARHNLAVLTVGRERH